MMDLNIFNICGFRGTWSIHAAACHRGKRILFMVKGGGILMMSDVGVGGKEEKGFPYIQDVYIQNVHLPLEEN